jgi:hypothetical protein
VIILKFKKRTLNYLLIFVLLFSFLSLISCRAIFTEEYIASVLYQHFEEKVTVIEAFKTSDDNVAKVIFITSDNNENIYYFILKDFECGFFYSEGSIYKKYERTLEYYYFNDESKVNQLSVETINTYLEKYYN